MEGEEPPGVESFVTQRAELILIMYCGTRYTVYTDNVFFKLFFANKSFLAILTAIRGGGRQ